MREILFRGKRKDNGEWIEGFLYKNEEHTYIGYSRGFDDCDLFYSPETVFVEILPESISEFTALTDKNGTKIFEGDIVEIEHTFRPFKFQEVSETYKPRRSHSCYWNEDYTEFHYKRNYAVEWKEREARFILRNGSDQHDLKRMYLLMHNGDVIGNIHDNPELLKGGDEG